MTTFIDDIPKELIVGRKYHCSWAKSRGFVWFLVEGLPNGKVVLETPRTRKRLITDAASLRNINKYCTTTTL